MDKELDEKLKTIVAEAQSYIDDDELHLKAQYAAIERIKASFKEAGYIKPDLATYYVAMIEAYLKAGGRADCILMSRNDWKVNAKLSGYMNGQEWLDRFTKEADSCSHYIRSLFREGYPTATKADEREMFVKQDILSAARRASGVSDE